MSGFEVIETRRKGIGKNSIEVFEPEIVDKPQDGNALIGAAAEHMGEIISIVSDIVSIQQLKVQTDADIRKMEESRKLLLTEAEVYVKKTNADTDNAVKKMEVIRGIMNDFYKYGSQSIASDDFCKIITTVISEADKI